METEELSRFRKVTVLVKSGGQFLTLVILGKDFFNPILSPLVQLADSSLPF